VLYLGTAFAVLPVALWLCTAFIAGFMLPVVLTQVFHQTERSVPKSQLNEANSWIISAFSLGIAGGTLLAGIIVGPSPTGWGIAIGVTLGSAIALVGALSASPRTLGRAPAALEPRTPADPPEHA
jgi:predicted MFS family arabinose efflux permease